MTTSVNFAPHTAQEQRTKTASEVLDAKVSFAGLLEGTETLSGTPTFSELTTSDLTLSGAAVSTAALTIDDVSVALGKAATVKISGGTAGRSYIISISCGTSAGNTRVGRVKLNVVAD